MPVVVLQPAAEGIDTWIDSASPATNRGTATGMRVGHRNNGWRWLLKFDMSIIPPGSAINSMTLELTQVGKNWGAFLAGTVMRIRRILVGNIDWEELQATWNVRYTGQAWAGSAGCSTDGVDRAATNLWEGTMPDVANGTVWSFPFTQVEAQQLFDANYGMIAYHTAVGLAADYFIEWGTSDHGTAASRPKLTIDYTEPLGRLARYRLDLIEGRRTIRDQFGARVRPEELRPNNWLTLEGLPIQTGLVHPSYIKDPRQVFIEEVEYDEDAEMLHIRSGKSRFTENLVNKIAGRSSA